MSRLVGGRAGAAGGGIVAIALALALTGVPGAPGGSASDARASEEASGAIRYKTIFQAPDATRAQDLSIENHAIALVNATPAGARISFAFRDFNRAPVVNALVAARDRGVDVRGVIDGGERGRAALNPLRTALGAKLVFCGSDVAFALHSCIASDPGPDDDGATSLQHNKFMTFSRLSDGRRHVVFQTSMNFLAPSQLTYFNDAVEIAGDVRLYEGYEQWVSDMMEQGPKRTDDRYTGFVLAGDDGRNTMFPSPRPQRDLDSDDTIVDRLEEIDCSDGGTIHVGMHVFRSARIVIMRKLAQLERAGCEVKVVLTTADADVYSGLASAGIEVTPLYWAAQGTALRHVRVHSKFWLVDAKNRETGVRTKIAYVGSSNWRGDQQYSDDLLLRVVDDGVYAEYLEFWELLEARASTDLELFAADGLEPVSTLTTASAANAAGWHRDEVAVRIGTSDGHVPNTTAGLARLHVDMSGAQTYSADVIPPDPRLPAIAELVVAEEGTTTITYWGEDARGNREEPRTEVIRMDRTAPAISMTGLLDGACELWPPNGLMTPVGEVSATDEVSGLADFDANALDEGSTDSTEVAVEGSTATVSLQATKAARGGTRTYTVTGGARDVAGNTGSRSKTCVVPHSQGASGG
jgi:hypothetical protein